MIALTGLASTTLSAAVYDDSQEQLRLDFRDGSSYVYFKVTADLFRHLRLQCGARGAVPVRFPSRLETAPTELFHGPRRSPGCLALSPARLQLG